MPSSNVEIRPAVEGDISLIHTLILELAEYEKLTHAVTADETHLKKALFGPRPAAEVLIASQDGTPAGYALYFQNYSTFLGQTGIYLEDLFVRPAFRGSGIGRKLLARLALVARERHCGRIEWAVLDWNKPAISFYESIGAQNLSDWRIFRLTGGALEKLAR